MTTTQVTIRNINECSEQSIFDFIAIFLLKQNKKAGIVEKDNFGIDKFICKYRGGTPNDPCMCAIGSIIPDEDYLPEYESKTINYLCGSVSLFSHIDLPRRSLLSKLQAIHDNYPVVNWENQLRHVATDFELNTKAIDDYLYDKNSSGSTGESECPVD
jgi:hypothetical protein